MKKTRMLMLLTFTALSWSSMATAENFVYREQLLGIGKSSDSSIPKCLSPEEGIPVGSQGKFCGHESEGELAYIGDINGYSILTGIADDPSGKWAGSSYETNIASRIDGLDNTINLINRYGDSAQAATTCYNKNAGGWYLPAIDELLLFKTNISVIDYDSINLDYQTNTLYWSSTEKNTGSSSSQRYNAELFEPSLGYAETADKSRTYRVRCVKRF